MTCSRQRNKDTEVLQMNTKERLAAYLKIVEENDREIARYEELEKGGNTYADKLNEIKQQIINRTNKEIAEKDYIKKSIAQLTSSSQRQIMTYRYIDRLDWNTVIKIMFHAENDYELNFDKYKRKVFKFHSRAIKNIDKMKSMQ